MTMTIPKRNQTFQLVLDEPVTYLGNTAGTSMVRGEVMVNFQCNTPIQGPIQLVFEGTEVFYPWKEITRSTSKPINTTLHRVQLSLLPPNAQGVMPSGVQRFPFEFPIPGYLPTTLSIPDRLNIGYTVTATLRRSPLLGSDQHAGSWLDWTRFSSKCTLTATARLHVVRSIESIPSLVGIDLLQQQHQQRQPTTAVSSHTPAATLSSATPLPSTHGHSSRAYHDRMALDRYFDLGGGDSELESLFGNPYDVQRPLGLSLDEQHDQLAYSMAGRSVNNWHRPISESEAGVRYELGIDRTAIAIGTSLGVHVHLEPQHQDIKIRSITARISEKRDYTIAVPSNHSNGRICKDSETMTMILKWAYGYPYEDVSCSSGGSSSEECDDQCKGKPIAATAKKSVLSGKYRHPSARATQEAAGTPGNTTSSPLGPPFSMAQVQTNDHGSAMWEKRILGGAYSTENQDQQHPVVTSSPMGTDNLQQQGKLLNLKFLNEKVRVGEYFDGWFVMPVPSCEHMLRPTMVHSSITISHWLYLDIVMDCSSDKSTRKLTLGTPMRLLDCRLTLGAAGGEDGDDKQMILPPPPSYEEALTCSRNSSNRNSIASTITDDFWLQRSSITLDSVWGTTCSSQCPCKTRKYKHKQQLNQPLQQIQQQWMPDWGPPPMYNNALR